MKITILGCGASSGVPLIGGNWGDCDPKNPKNARLRGSILVQEEKGDRPADYQGEEGIQTLLFDTSPDMREQLLRANVQDVTAIIYTHAHADHSHGIDNIRTLNWHLKRDLPIYADEGTLTEIQTYFPYIFETRDEIFKYYKPAVKTHLLHDHEIINFGSLRLNSFQQKHGPSFSRGFRINNFAYTTDVTELSEEAFEIIKGVKVWVLGVVRREEHPTHVHLSEALKWIDRVKPEMTYLVHMNETMDYDSLCEELPAHVRPAYDGLEISL